MAKNTIYKIVFSLVFSAPENYGDITFKLSPKIDGKGISWFTEIINRSDEFSVMWVDYPIPRVTADTFNMFIPSCSGRVIADIGNIGFKMKDTYPHHYSSMQYFAYYGKESGIYLGIHDENMFTTARDMGKILEEAVK